MAFLSFLFVIFIVKRVSSGQRHSDKGFLSIASYETLLASIIDKSR